MTSTGLLQAAYQIATTSSNLTKICSTNQTDNVKAGRVAEEAHAETFNLDAVAKGRDPRAQTERYEGFSSSGYERNGVSDIVITNSTDDEVKFQSKYHQTAEGTATALRVLNQDGSPRYGGHGLLVPADQVDSVRKEARRTRLQNEQPNGRPAVARAAKMVEGEVSERISKDGIESMPLTLRDARAIARDNDGPERRAQQEPVVRCLLQHEKADEEAAGRSFDPDTLFKGDDIDRLINNGVVDENGDATWVFWSTDPVLTDDELAEHEKARLRIIGSARQS